jgi:hypothetical protein
MRIRRINGPIKKVKVIVPDTLGNAFEVEGDRVLPCSKSTTKGNYFFERLRSIDLPARFFFHLYK